MLRRTWPVLELRPTAGEGSGGRNKKKGAPSGGGGDGKKGEGGKPDGDGSTPYQCFKCDGALNYLTEDKPHAKRNCPISQLSEEELKDLFAGTKPKPKRASSAPSGRSVNAQALIAQVEREYALRDGDDDDEEYDVFDVGRRVNNM